MRRVRKKKLTPNGFAAAYGSDPIRKVVDTRTPPKAREQVANQVNVGSSDTILLDKAKEESDRWIVSLPQFPYLIGSRGEPFQVAGLVPMRSNDEAITLDYALELSAYPSRFLSKVVVGRRGVQLHEDLFGDPHAPKHRWNGKKGDNLKEPFLFHAIH